MSRHLLILDLDETLIHASVRPLNYPPDYTIPPYHIYKRPFLTHFLQTCTRHFEIAIWTSSSADYAQPIISQVWPQDVALAFIWSRERCTYRLDTEQGIYVWIKDLKKLKRKGYALERIVVVDNDPEKLTRQYGNLVCVKSYEGDSEDNELYLLSLYLQELAQEEDVRRIDKRFWRLRARGRSGV